MSSVFFPPQKPPRYGVSPGGFSLIELLAVIAVLAMVLAIGAPSMQSVVNGSGVRGAVNVAGSAVEHARLEALRHGGGARIVIDADPNSEHYLRRIAVLSGQRQQGTTGWKMNYRPLVLPDRAYFYPEYSGGFATMQYDFRDGGWQDGTKGSPCYYFEYDSQGRLVPPNASGVSQAVFVGGVVRGNGELDVPPADQAGRGGFILRRAGNLTYFDATTSIDKP